MSENGKERFILTKAYEVAYALFRLAAQMQQEKDFSEKLRACGATLLEAAAAEDYEAAGRSVQVMECLIKFAGDVNVIGTANADVLLREIYALDAAIAERKMSGKTDKVNVAEIFSKAEPEVQSKHEVKTSSVSGYRSEPTRSEPAIAEPSILHTEEIVAPARDNY